MGGAMRALVVMFLLLGCGDKGSDDSTVSPTTGGTSATGTTTQTTQTTLSTGTTPATGSTASVATTCPDSLCDLTAVTVTVEHRIDASNLLEQFEQCDCIIIAEGTGSIVSWDPTTGQAVFEGTLVRTDAFGPAPLPCQNGVPASCDPFMADGVWFPDDGLARHTFTFDLGLTPVQATTWAGHDEAVAANPAPGPGAEQQQQDFVPGVVWDGAPTEPVLGFQDVVNSGSMTITSTLSATFLK